MLAAAHQRGDIVGQLQGGEQVVGLADGGGDGLAVRPLPVVAVRPLRRGQHTAGIADLNAGGRAKTELGGVAVQRADPGQASHLVEEVVAGDGDGLGHIDAPVGSAALLIDPAHGLGMRIIGIDAAVLNDGGGGDDAALQRRHGGTHLEGGAGGVHTLRGAVEHGQTIIRHKRLVVLVEGGQVIGGVAGQCQHLAAAHRYHGGSAAALVAVLVDHAGDGVGQRLLHIGL